MRLRSAGPPATRTAVTSGHPWTDDEDTELREGIDAGLSLDELADHFELEPEVVEARLATLKLSLQPQSGFTFDA